MRFAIVNKSREQASPGNTGACPACNSPVIAKCGPRRVRHWAHRGVRVCDQWWEPMTQWHYAWQNEFPKTWQERIQFADSGEKHIADVHTELGATIEFQHSYLRLEELAARENFYKNLVWVVNGARLRRDLPRFLEGLHLHTRSLRKGVRLTLAPERLFPSTWLNRKVPVFFDFEKAEGLTEAALPVVQKLWCLLPGRIRGMAVVLQVSRQVFVRWAHERPQLIPARAILRDIEQLLVAEEQATLKQIARQRAAETLRHQWLVRIAQRRRNPLPRF